MITIEELETTIANQASNWLELRLVVKPQSRKPGFNGLHGDALKLAVQEAAIENKANIAVMTCFAERLGLSRSDISITNGRKSRRKVIRLTGNAESIKSSLLKVLNSEK